MAIYGELPRRGTPSFRTPLSWTLSTRSGGADLPLSSIAIDLGEQPHPIHADDQMIPLPRVPEVYHPDQYAPSGHFGGNGFVAMERISPTSGAWASP
jgi:hypothetical protein